MTEVKDLDAATRTKLVQDLAAKAKEHGLGGSIDVYREDVTILMAGQKSNQMAISYTKKFGPDMKEKVDACKADLVEIAKDVTGVKINLGVEVGQGSQYMTINNITTMESEDKTELAHDGQVWLLDFWATWCPPCQAPMAHNVKMLEENPDWKGKIRIIGLSIDQDKGKLKSHVEAKGWGNVDHFFRGESDASSVYGVSGVPCVLIIDKTGKIVFKGHPASRPDLKGDLEKLSNGEMPEGLGGAAAGGAGGEESKGNTTLTLDECLKEAETFSKETQQKLIDDLKDTCNGMPRAFCVLTVNGKTDIDSGAQSVDYHNHRVFVGPGDKVDAALAKCKELVNNGAEVLEKAQKM